MTVPATPGTSRTETREAKVERLNRFDAAADRFDGDAPPPNARAASPGAAPGFPGGTQATAARARPAVPAAPVVPSLSSGDRESVRSAERLAHGLEAGRDDGHLAERAGGDAGILEASGRRHDDHGIAAGDPALGP